MARYTLTRLGWTVVVLWTIVTLTFAAVFLSPVDPARVYAGERASAAVVEQTRQNLGLDEPVWEQYTRYVSRLLHGDLGESFYTGNSVLDSTLNRIPKTALLAGTALAFALALGIPLGVAAALRRGTSLDRAILFGSLIGVITPSFVLGFLLLYYLAFRLGWFPLGGSDSLRSLILPAVTLGLPAAAWYARMTRSTVLNIVSEDYVRNARAKGLPERIVVFRHVLRNAAAPIVTMVGLDLGILLGGVLIIENVFGWEGLGQQTWKAVDSNDIPLVMGTVLCAAFFVAIFNLIADLANAVLDPRVRYG
jgi:peptide/nickel transport system permease protein